MSLTARERRLVAIGVLILALGLAWLLIAAPILGGFTARHAEREALRATLERDQRLLRAFPTLRARQRALAVDASDYGFRTSDAAAARGAAEAKVAAAVSAAGGVLHAVRSQPAAPGTVRLRADAALTLPTLVRLLQTLKDGRPYAVVEDMSVARGEAAPGQMLGQTPGQAPGVLEVRIDVVYAYAAPLR